MIQKLLEDITPVDLDALISNAVPEGKAIEYKRILPGGSHEQKREFVADVSSFANTAGGDLIFGVESEKGLPVSIPGIEAADLDAELLRLDSLIQDGISPRIRHPHTRIIRHTNWAVLILRIEPSWFGPHRVTLAGHDKFYARNSAGKYSLDVHQLRQAFLGSASTIEGIRNFRQERLIEIARENTPVPIKLRAKVVLHILPLESFTTPPSLDIKEIYKDSAPAPISIDGYSRRYTLEGVLSYTAGARTPGYVQLYRTGVVEAVDSYLLNAGGGEKNYIPSQRLEGTLIGKIQDYVGLLHKFRVQLPIYVFISFLGVEGYWMATPPSRNPFDNQGYSLERDVIQLPEAVLTTSTDPVDSALRAPIDMLWNAFGIERSPFFDAEGNWRAR